MSYSSVVRMVSRLAVGVCLAACGSSNGTLFDEGASADGADLEGQADEPAPSADAEPEPEPITDPPGDESPSSELPSDDDLPLTGGSAVPPVNSRPEPPDTTEQPAPSEPEPEGPVVVSVSPSDGATGVDNGENIVIGVRWPTGHEATGVTYIDHNLGTVVKDFIATLVPLAEVVDIYAQMMPAGGFDRVLDPAEARAHIEAAVRRWSTAWPPVTNDGWPVARPVRY